MNDKFEVFTDDAFPGQFRVVGDKIEKVSEGEEKCVERRVLCSVVSCGVVFFSLNMSK